MGFFEGFNFTDGRSSPFRRFNFSLKGHLSMKKLGPSKISYYMVYVIVNLRAKLYNIIM